MAGAQGKRALPGRASRAGGCPARPQLGSGTDRTFLEVITAWAVIGLRSHAQGRRPQPGQQQPQHEHLRTPSPSRPAWSPVKADWGLTKPRETSRAVTPRLLGRTEPCVFRSGTVPTTSTRAPRPTVISGGHPEGGPRPSTSRSGRPIHQSEHDAGNGACSHSFGVRVNQKTGERTPTSLPAISPGY